jgi:hypothetical protein
MPIQENILPPLNEQTIRSGLEEFGGIANRITDFMAEQQKAQEQYNQLYQLLMKSMLQNMYKPKMTGNPFLDMVTSYTLAKQRTNPDYEFKGLLGNFLAKKPPKTVLPETKSMPTPEVEYLGRQTDLYNQTYRSGY